MNSNNKKKKIKKKLRKWKVASRKVEKSEILMIFELQTVPIFRLGDENFMKKSSSYVSESTFYPFYSLKTKIYKKFWKSEKLRAEKVEKSKIFMILSNEKVPIFDFRHGIFWENNVCTSQKTVFLNPNQLKKIRKKISKSRKQHMIL